MGHLSKGTNSSLSIPFPFNYFRQTLIAAQSPYLTNGDIITGYNAELVSNIPVSVGVGLGVRSSGSIYDESQPILQGFTYGNGGQLLNVNQ